MSGLNSIIPSAEDMLRGTRFEDSYYLDRSLVPTELLDLIDDGLKYRTNASNSATEPQRSSIFFGVGEPKTFEQYGGQPQITRYLSAVMQGWQGDDMHLPAQAFTGQAGGGKSLLARVTTNEIRARNIVRGLPDPEFIEVFGADVSSVEALDKVMRRVQSHPGCVMFIDELHSVADKEYWLKFYLVLQENRYLFEGDQYPTALPPFTVLAATTDFGMLPEPWRRRFIEQRFVPATYEQILSYVKNRGFAITDAAAKAIVDRTHFNGAPWEALQVFTNAVIFAKARQSPRVELDDVQEVWDSYQIDELGLRPVDREIIRVLFMQPRYRRSRETGEQEFVCYAASEVNTVTMARIDKAEYRDYVRPKLMGRGLLEIRVTYGQALTNRAVETYAWLKPEDEQNGT